MSAADQGMRPGGQTMAGWAGSDAAARGVQHVLGSFAGEDATAPSRNDVALEAKPIVEVVGNVGVQAAEIRGKGRGVEMNEFIADG